MANLFIITSGITSIVNATLEMANRLVTDGHRVTIGSTAEISDQVSRTGMHFLLLEDLQTQCGNQVSSDRAFTQFRSVISAGAFDLAIVDVECHEFSTIACGA